MTTVPKAVTSKQLQYLHELGLSDHAVQLYEILLARSKLTASEAAGWCGRFPSAQYRLLYQLEKYGLARRIRQRPVVFEAILPGSALPASLTLNEARLKRLLEKSLVQSSSSQTFQVRLIVGRQALYHEYVALAATAYHSIRRYTIGIAYSDELIAAERAAIIRGVRIRHIAQQLKPSNYHVLHTWRRLGVQVRLNPSERGFHLMLFDDTVAVVSFSNPLNTEDRLSIVTDNPAIIKLFGSQFESLWQIAREIDV